MDENDVIVIKLRWSYDLHNYLEVFAKNRAIFVLCIYFVFCT